MHLGSGLCLCLWPDECALFVCVCVYTLTFVTHEIDSCKWDRMFPCCVSPQRAVLMLLQHPPNQFVTGVNNLIRLHEEPSNRANLGVNLFGSILVGWQGYGGK